MNKIINWCNKKNIDFLKVDNDLKKCVENGIFTNYGENVQKLEKIIKDKFKVIDEKSVIVVSNGTIAIHILASAISIYNKISINWASQSFTFPSSCQGTLQNCNIVDINNDNSGINLDEITKNINGIIITNTFGYLCDINKYVDFCNNNNKYLIFDNAASSYSFYKNINCINYGIGCTVSLHHTKPIGFGEGGFIIVDKKYDPIVRSLINFGFKMDKEFTKNNWSNEGNNAKMSEISAIYINQYIENNFENIITKTKLLNDYFIYKLNNYYKNIDCKMLNSYHDNIIFPSCFPLVFNNYNDNIRLFLIENNIVCRKYYEPLMDTYNSKKLYDNILCIPCNIDMEYSDIDFILDKINKYYTLNFYNIHNIKNIKIEYPDIYYTPEYGKACEYSDDGIWELCHYKDLIYVYLKKVYFFEDKEYYDLISPYGYSGYYFKYDKTYNEFINLFRNEAKNRNYITEVIKQNPYLNINISNYDIITKKDIFYININNYDYYYNKILKSSNRNKIKKAVNLNYTYKILKLTENLLNENFIKLYNLTMDRVNANKYYYFNDFYFNQIEKINNCFIINIYDKDINIIGSSIILKYNNLIHYHLSCNNNSSNCITNYLLNIIIEKFGFENKIILGGGIKENDTLHNFKKNISTDFYNYVIYKNIINEEIYNKINFKLLNNTENNYFPIHRK
jgi:dTDP-4-amino-4,6-dideoxygalactose transaminase